MEGGVRPLFSNHSLIRSGSQMPDFLTENDDADPVSRDDEIAPSDPPRSLAGYIIRGFFFRSERAGPEEDGRRVCQRDVKWYNS